MVNVNSRHLIKVCKLFYDHSRSRLVMKDVTDVSKSMMGCDCLESQAQSSRSVVVQWTDSYSLSLCMQKIHLERDTCTAVRTCCPSAIH